MSFRTGTNFARKISYTYDALGRQVQVNDSAFASAYDDLGRQIAIWTGAEATLTDARTLATTLTEYGYDKLNRLSSRPLASRSSAFSDASSRVNRERHTADPESGRHRPGRQSVFGLFKSKATRLCEKWIRFNAELVRGRLRDVWAVERTCNDAADFKVLEGRLFSEFFAGYLAGFADVLVTKLVEDEPSRARYSRLFFESVMTARGGEWVLANIVQYTKMQGQEFAAGFSAGCDDARTHIATKKPQFANLGSFLIRGKAA